MHIDVLVVSTIRTRIVGTSSVWEILPSPVRVYMGL